MNIKLLKPYTSSTRHRKVSDMSELSKSKPEKTLTFYKHRAKGRNGKITCRHRGGGHKRLYREIELLKTKIGVKAQVVSIEYDPNRNARIALLRYEDGEKRYIIQPKGLKVGDTVLADVNAPIVAGNSLPLRNIPLGAEVHNVEMQPGSGGQLARAAGSHVVVIAKEGNYVTVRLPSKQIRLIHKNCWATIGKVGNVEAFRVRIGKAGRSRWLGIRPTVRGSAMNPIDHPHGGSTGKSSIGLKHPKTPWGKPALGVKTRKPNKYSNRFIIRTRS